MEWVGCFLTFLSSGLLSTHDFPPYFRAAVGVEFCPWSHVSWLDWASVSMPLLQHSTSQVLRWAKQRIPQPESAWFCSVWGHSTKPIPSQPQVEFWRYRMRVVQPWTVVYVPGHGRLSVTTLLPNCLGLYIDSTTWVNTEHFQTWFFHLENRNKNVPQRVGVRIIIIILNMIIMI